MLKKSIKKYSPTWAIKPLRRGYSKWVEFSVNRFDAKLFRKHRLQQLRGASIAQLESKLFFHAHSIEKGLSHRDLRPNFGQNALTSLADTMQEYVTEGFDMSRPAYVNALSVLKEYVEKHTGLNAKPTILYSIFDENTLQLALECGEDMAGTKPVTRESKANNLEKNFGELFQNRISIREFSDVPVTKDRLLPAIELAVKSPSVCNRQSARLKILTDQPLIGRVLAIQGGFSGFKTPTCLLIVTADLETFLGPTERNQAFIDGGIYSMSLLLALEYFSLAACPLNAMLKASEEKQVKELLSLPESERIILFIAVGEFDSEVLAPKSYRNPAETSISDYPAGE